MLLCHNCHSELHYLGKEVNPDTRTSIDLKEGDPSGTVPPTSKICAECARKIWHGSKTGRCSKCYPRKRKLEISKEELTELVEIRSYEYIGRMFGVTGKAVRKRCDTLDIPRKTKNI